MNGWNRIYMLLLVICAVLGTGFLVLSTAGRQWQKFLPWVAFFYVPIAVACMKECGPRDNRPLSEIVGVGLWSWALSVTACAGLMWWFDNGARASEMFAVVFLLLVVGWGPMIALLLINWIVQGFVKKQ
jgi:hypothetical protein